MFLPQQNSLLIGADFDPMQNERTSRAEYSHTLKIGLSDISDIYNSSDWVCQGWGLWTAGTKSWNRNVAQKG
jgi:hypothetical protein